MRHLTHHAAGDTIRILPVKGLRYKLVWGFDLESGIKSWHWPSLSYALARPMPCPLPGVQTMPHCRSVSQHSFVQSFTPNICEIRGWILTFWVCRDNFGRPQHLLSLRSKLFSPFPLNRRQSHFSINCYTGEKQRECLSLCIKASLLGYSDTIALYL